MGQDTKNILSTDSSMLVVVSNLMYLGSIISANLGLDAEINAHIGKTATAMGTLSKRAKLLPHSKHQTESLPGVCTQPTFV